MRINRERQLQLDAGDTAATIATEQGNLQVDLLKLREASGPGAAGHEDQVNERIAKFRDDIASHMGNNPELAARFGDNVAEIAANARTGEVKWAMEQRAKKSVDDSDTLQNGLQSNIRTASPPAPSPTRCWPTPTSSTSARSSAADRRQRPGATDQGAARRAARYADRRQDRRRPAAVMQEIDKGKYGELDDKVLQPLREHARVRADQLANEASRRSMRPWRRTAPSPAT
jgi:hypothetical protein